MTQEKRNDLKDVLNTALLCGLVFIVVGHLHSFFGGDKSAKSDKAVVTKNIVKTDSVRTDSVPTASFVRCQMQQQRTK